MFIPVRHLWWLAAGGSAGYTARYMKARINFALAERRRRRTPDPSGELLRLQTLYGYNAHSMVSIAPGAELWSTPDIDGAIIYGEFGRVWLAAGDPLCSPDEAAELARQFAAEAKLRNRAVAFVPTTERFARMVATDGFAAVKVGAAPYFDLQNWNPRRSCAPVSIKPHEQACELKPSLAKRTISSRKKLRSFACAGSNHAARELRSVG